VGIASKPAIWAKIMRLPRPADLSARPADFGATHAVKQGARPADRIETAIRAASICYRR
jgi:hypothetical protein